MPKPIRTVSRFGTLLWQEKGRVCARRGFDPKTEFVNDPALNALEQQGYDDERAKIAAAAKAPAS